MTDDPRDHELSRIYREGAWPEPRQQLDDAILEASRRAARARRSASLVWRFGPPFALAATVVLTFTWVLRVYEEQPQMLAPPAAKKHPAPGAAQPAAHPAESKLAVEPKPEAAPQAGPAQEPLAAPRSAPAPAPASSAFALKKQAPEAARADRLQRGFEPLEERQVSRESAPSQTLREKPPVPRPEAVAAPSPAAATPAGQAPAVGAVSAAAAGAAVAARAGNALEGSPEAWLEDIRKLKAQGKNDDLQRELAEFRKRYPDYPLPDDLR